MFNVFYGKNQYCPFMDYCWDKAFVIYVFYLKTLLCPIIFKLFDWWHLVQKNNHLCIYIVVQQQQLKIILHYFERAVKNAVFGNVTHRFIIQFTVEWKKEACIPKSLQIVCHLEWKTLGNLKSTSVCWKPCFI